MAQAPLQHQQQPGWQPSFDTLPPQVAGQAYNVPWEPPQFPMRTKHFLHQTEARVPRLPDPPAAPSGVPYNVPWEPPRFFGVPAGRQQTEMFTQTAATVPVGVSGSAWMRPWEPPYFPPKFKTELAQTQAWSPNLIVIAPPPSGIPFLFQWEPPYFKGVPAHQQPTQFFVSTASIFPPIVATMWQVPFSEPYFSPRVKAQFQPGPAIALTPATLPPRIAGMAWRVPFDQPTQRKTPLHIQQFIMQGSMSVTIRVPYSWVSIIF